VPSAYLLLFVANLVFATSYSVTRVVLADIPPATLGLARSVIGAAILFSLVVSVAAGLYPANRAARIDPTRALRHD